MNPETIGPEFKQSLLELCKNLLRERMAAAENAMKNAQEAANNEEKSSAGDKYETSRAMGHLDRDMYARQYQEAAAELARLERISLDTTEKIRTGSLVETGEGYFFILSGLGKVMHHGLAVTLISPLSPIAKSLTGKTAGTLWQFMGKEHVLLRVI